MARIPRKLAGIGASDLADAAAFDDYTGPAREVTVDPDRGILALHDGVTPGGRQFTQGGGGGGDEVAVAADRSALAGLAAMGLAYLGEGVRAGIFRCVLRSALSAELQAAAVTDDANSQGVFVISTEDEDFVWMRDDFRRWRLKADWFGVVVDSSEAATANTTAFQNMIALIPSNGTINLSVGLAYTQPLTIAKAISWRGVGKLNSGLIHGGTTSDLALLNYEGTTSSRIQNISMRDFAIWGAADAPANRRAMNLTWVNKSNFEDLYFYNLRRGVTGDNMWSNSFKNVSAQGIDGELSYTFWLQDECNNIHFDRVEFRGLDGCKVTGNCAGLTFTQCNPEGIKGTGSSGIHLAPTTGKKISGVTISSYFERVEGAGIRVGGADADSVHGLNITGSYFFGGNAAYYSGASDRAAHAIILTNCRGFVINGNKFIDWRYGIFIDSTALDGEIKHNPETSLSQGFQQGMQGASVTIDRANS